MAPTRQQAILSAMRVSPMFFRENLQVSVEDQRAVRFGDRMAAYQRADFAAVDPCLLWLGGHASDCEKRKFWNQRARGHSKTTDWATTLAWLLAFSKRRVGGVVVAEDEKQSWLLRDSIELLCRLNPFLAEIIECQRSFVVNKRTGSKVEFLANDPKSIFGATPDFIVCDEFTHWSDEALWTAVFSAAPKKSGLLAILCNAGAGRDWKWRVRAHAERSPQWYFSSPDGIQASWIDPEDLAEQRACLPPAEYARLWMNRWQETDGGFVTLEEAEDCVDPELREMTRHHHDGWKYVAAVDYAEKIDRTVCCVTHLEGRKVIVDRMDVVCPRINRTATRIDWVENWMENVERDFGGRFGQVYFVLDEYQLLGTIQRLEAKHRVQRFNFASGDGNWKMGLLLRKLMIHQQIAWYEGCGRIVDAEGRALTGSGRDDLCAELASLVVKRYSSGRKWRFDHHDDGIHHDDRAVALGMACLTIAENSGGLGYWGVTEPTAAGSFNMGAVA